MLLHSNRYQALAVIWLLFISVLFFLPGTALPKDPLFNVPFFDKYIHFAFFAVLVYLWRFFWPVATSYTWGVCLLASLYGLSVEVIQHYFVINRSFDGWDLTADTAGSVFGVWIWNKVYKKK